MFRSRLSLADLISCDSVCFCSKPNSHIKLYQFLYAKSVISKYLVLNSALKIVAIFILCFLG